MSAPSVPTAVPGAICILINTFIVVFRGGYAVTPVADEETESREWSSLCPLSLSKLKDRQCFSEPGLIASVLCALPGGGIISIFSPDRMNSFKTVATKAKFFNHHLSFAPNTNCGRKATFITTPHLTVEGNNNK